MLQVSSFLLCLTAGAATLIAQVKPAAIAQAKPAANPYLADAAAGVATLQTWYVPSTGLYKTNAWWNYANNITVLAEFSKASGSRAYFPAMQNTYAEAQKLYPGFINHFYDDEGWWALAWIDAFDATGNHQYLTMAQAIFKDMAGGWDSATCGGGIWWNKDAKYKNAIANELFLSVAARLANHAANPSRKAEYVGWAQKEWDWFARSGMINGQHLVNDGLNSSNPAHCVNNGQAVWTYNQGVILNGLVELNRAGRADATLPATAQEIADAAFQHLTDAKGILHDQGEAKAGPGGGGVQFKGIFMRNLLSLQKAAPNPQYARFFTINADSVWTNARGGDYQLGQVWSGPFGGATAGSQSSALDALLAAQAGGAQR